MKFVDTNVFIRLLAADDEKKSEACYRLFERVQQGEERLTTSETVIAEVVYVLSSTSLYNLQNEEIAVRLAPILALRGLHIRQKETLLRALEIYSVLPFLDFEDALAVAHMERQNIAEIVTYDRDFDRVSGVRRVEP